MNLRCEYSVTATASLSGTMVLAARRDGAAGRLMARWNGTAPREAGRGRGMAIIVREASLVADGGRRAQRWLLPLASFLQAGLVPEALHAPHGETRCWVGRVSGDA